MILLSYDIEGTGLDKQADRIIELGLVLYSTGQDRVLESTGFLVQSDGVKVSEEITGITGIHQAAVDKFGYSQEDAVDDFIRFAEQADAVLAHNGGRYDEPMIKNAANRLQKTLPQRLLIDTMVDIPGVKGEQLITMCAKAGILLTGAHGALADATATLEMARRHSKDPLKSFDKMAERAKSPLVLVQSHQDRNKNEDVKKFKFRWSPAPMKIWWRAVKEMDMQELVSQAPFDISRIDKSVTMEMLDRDS